MTREEQTISNLKKLKSFHNGSYGADIKIAINALKALDKVIAYCKQSPSAILPEDVLSLIRGEDVEIETDYGYEKFEPCSNAISRQAVDVLVDELARAISDERCCISRGRSTATIMQDIFDLPPVNPQEKTGHWVKPQQDDGMSDPIYYQVRCSECGFDLDPQTWYEELHQYGADKYCPNCGARMEKED